MFIVCFFNVDSQNILLQLAIIYNCLHRKTKACVVCRSPFRIKIYKEGRRNKNPDQRSPPPPPPGGPEKTTGYESPYKRFYRHQQKGMHESCVSRHHAQRCLSARFQAPISCEVYERGFRPFHRKFAILVFGRYRTGYLTVLRSGGGHDHEPSPAQCIITSS